MKAYSITYTVNGTEYNASVDAKDLKSAKKKLERKHKGAVKIKESKVIGYF